MKKILLFIVILSVLFAGISCVSSSSSTKDKGDSGKKKTKDTEKEQSVSLPDEKEYTGGGQSDSLAEAMRLAKVSAVQKGVIEIIGKSKEEANRAKLDKVLYDSRNIGGYVEMKERTRKDKVDEEYVYEGVFIVKLKAIENTLKAQGIIGEQEKVLADKDKDADKDVSLKDDDDISLKDDASSKDEDVSLKDEDVYEKLTVDEEKFIKRYVDKLTFLVFFAEDSAEDPFYTKGAITIANDYLISNKRTVIDFVQAEKLKKDNELIYEEETGGSISITQWIAQKLNADIYIELAGETQGKSEVGGKYYGTANVTTKAYDASTAELVGSVAGNLQDVNAAFSKVSQQDARLKAIQGLVYSKVMPEMFRQINNNMVDKLKKLGIRYEVIIQNPPNDRIMNKLWKKLDRDIKAHDVINQTQEEVKYAVYFIGDLEGLKNVFYDATESITELEAMYAVLARGKTITFNSGL